MTKTPQNIPSVFVPNAQDICSCSACGKMQERYLFVIEDDKYICVHCWLSNANKYIANESTENRVNEYRKNYFSSNT
jgi:hypothetical protein